jgi:hypothetical protein
MILNTYDLILQGHEATIEDAIDTALGIDWQEVETTEQSLKGLYYQDTINGVDIWHCPSMDYICFSPSKE